MFTVKNQSNLTSAPATVNLNVAIAATHFTVVAPSDATTGSPVTFVVTAVDNNGNTASAYAGTVQFSSTDNAAALPGNATLNLGTGTFTATLNTAGSQTITAADTFATSIAGSSGVITVTNGIVHTFPAGLVMISVPTNYDGDPISDVLGYASPVMAVWEPSADVYAVTPTPPSNSLVAGQGYWIRFPHTVTITALGTAPAVPFTIDIAAGWNMIGCPQSTSVALSALSVIDSTNEERSFAGAASAGVVQDPMYTFQEGDTNYEVVTGATGSLVPYEGYWMYSFAPCTLAFP